MSVPFTPVYGARDRDRLMPLAGYCTAGPPEIREGTRIVKDQPNVVFICADQWRGDCLSIDGHPVLRTPHLDQLAARGARFTRAYSAAPTCIPARTALMTGLSQRTHRRVGYQDGVEFDVATTLAGEFRRGGYQTQAIGKMHVYPERSRIGFDDVILHDGYLHHSRQRVREYAHIDDYLPWLHERDACSDYADSGLDCNSIVARPWHKPEALHPTNWLASQAVNWLYRRDPTQPFLLYLSFVSPHSPLHPPAWAFEQYLDAPPYEPVVGDWWSDYAQFRDDHRLDSPVACLEPATLHRARAGYFGNIAHVDLQIHRFLTALAEFGLADDTIVAFTADHGDMLGEHHLFRKGVPYEGSARIPLLLTGPAYTGIRPGIALDHVVELRDVMPTLLDCAGLPIPDSVEGRSVLPLARGTQPEGWRPYLHGEHTWLGQSLQWLTDGREKYCWLSGAGQEQLFDLVLDPSETRNLTGNVDDAARLARWRAILIEELRDREEGFVDGERLVPGRRPRTMLRAAQDASSRR